MTAAVDYERSDNTRPSFGAESLEVHRKAAVARFGKESMGPSDTKRYEERITI
jgi:hypothetical protein